MWCTPPTQRLQGVARHLLMTGGFACAAAATPALAAGNMASALGMASATVIAPISVTQVADLDFGTLTGGHGAAGTITVATGGGATYAGSAQAVCGATGCLTPHAARFAVRGEPGRAYVVTAPASITANGSTLAGGTAPGLVIDALTIRTDSRPAASASGILDGNGTDGFDVGGTLELTPDLVPARYRAWFPMLVSYG